MNACAIQVSKWVRKTDPIFGRVERFERTATHHVQVKIGNNYFVSTRDYPSAEAARRAAERLESRT